jgi:hypothetical protein
MIEIEESASRRKVLNVPYFWSKLTMFPLFPLASIFTISDEIVRSIATGEEQTDLAFHLA